MEEQEQNQDLQGQVIELKNQIAELTKIIKVKGTANPESSGHQLDTTICSDIAIFKQHVGDNFPQVYMLGSSGQPGTAFTF